MRQNMISNEGQLILAIKEEQILVAPESRVDIHVGIINQGVNEDYFDIQVHGVPSDWTTIDTPVVHLAAEEAKQITLTIQPPALPQNRAGQYYASIHPNAFLDLRVYRLMPRFPLHYHNYMALYQLDNMPGRM